ncbi:MAG TPA: polyhydroxyalkanoate synthesis regulator DNA-binding domain-containing protein [Acetobacteraceae bacterium]|jgi:polyhydroxyalkanoate synthesis regulator protein
MPAVRNPSPILVKRYAGSRLYDTTNRRYVALDQLREWTTVRAPFLAIDSETGQDITRTVLLR